jgi:hypothetical protein
LFIPINESIQLVERVLNISDPFILKYQRQVIPLSYETYTNLMSKPYKEPLKNQAWRLLVNNAGETDPASPTTSHDGQKLAEIIMGHIDAAWDNNSTKRTRYIIRYIRRPKPIIIAPLTGVTLGGYNGNETEVYTQSSDGMSIVNPCELDESLHEEILQRAVELAKVAWTATGQENVNLVMQAGQRSE